MNCVKYILIITLLTAVIFPSVSEETVPDDVRRYVQEYRKEKSICFALSGMQISNVLHEKYWHNNVSILGDGSINTIYILSDDYSIDSFRIQKDKVVEYRGRMTNKLLKTAKEDVYYMHIREGFKGIIKDKQIEYYPETEFYIYYYDVSRTDEGLKIWRDNTFSGYRILESDVPLLLERLQK
jgi:hypothetical protein